MSLESRAARARRSLHTSVAGVVPVGMPFVVRRQRMSLLTSFAAVAAMVLAFVGVASAMPNFFDPDQVAEKTKQGVAKASDALTLGIEQIKEFNHRRRGFGLATIFITLLVVALFFKIRQMEGN